MSTTLSLACAAPALDQLVDAIGLDALRVDGDHPAGPMPAGVYRLYLDGISTRATEVTVADRRFDVRIFSLASADDVALAVRIVEHVAASMGVTEVDAEDHGVVDVRALATIYDRAWADRRCRSGVDTLRALVRDGRGPITIPGPRRDYCFGPTMLAALEAAGPRETEPDRMLAAIRAVQWLPARTAGIFIAKRDGKDCQLAIWLGDEVVFPAVPLAALSLERPGQPPEVLLIDSVHVPALAGPHWHPIDESQGHITAVSDWPSVVAAARAFAKPRSA